MNPFIGASKILVAPQGEEEYPNFGTVEAVGPGYAVEACETCGIAAGRVPLAVKVGDRVMFKRRAASALHPDSRFNDDRGYKDLLRLQECDLYGIVMDETPEDLAERKVES